MGNGGTKHGARRRQQGGIPDEERYNVDEVQSIKGPWLPFPLHHALVETLLRVGFYGVTHYLSFREDFEVSLVGCTNYKETEMQN